MQRLHGGCSFCNVIEAKEVRAPIMDRVESFFVLFS